MKHGRIGTDTALCYRRSHHDHPERVTASTVGQPVNPNSELPSVPLLPQFRCRVTRGPPILNALSSSCLTQSDSFRRNACGDCVPCGNCGCSCKARQREQDGVVHSFWKLLRSSPTRNPIGSSILSAPSTTASISSSGSVIVTVSVASDWPSISASNSRVAS